MSKKLYEETNIRDIANAIREKNGTQNQYTVAQMSSAVRAITTQPDLETLNATSNGHYSPSAGKDGFSEVNVQVPSSSNLETLNVTSNGHYSPSAGKDGFSEVTVAVEGGGGIVDSIQEIGGLNGTNFARLSIDATDRVTRGDRYFQRNTNEPIIFFPLKVVNGAYTGYACINFRPTAPSGTYTSYGDLGGSLEKTTQSGATYYLTAMTGAYPPSTDSNKLRFQIGGTEHSINIGNADVYLGDDPYFEGDSQAIALLESYIDRVYNAYYAN